MLPMAFPLGIQSPSSGAHGSAVDSEKLQQRVLLRIYTVFPIIAFLQKEEGATVPQGTCSRLIVYQAVLGAKVDQRSRTAK